MSSSLTRAALAELVGTTALTLSVVGSGIMGTRVSDDTGVVLLINAVATVLALGILIYMFGPVSGAHFNPAVTLAARIAGSVSSKTLVWYVGAQLFGAFIGVTLAQQLFDIMPLAVSGNDRATSGTFISEFVMTVGLVALIQESLARGQRNLVAILVPAYIGAGYLLSSSTGFVNPAVTFARTLTDSFTGISPESALLFISAQLIAASMIAFILKRRIR